MEWSRIDLFPSGKAGIEAKWRVEDGDVYCFIGGSDHWVDWLHHFLPGSEEREIICAAWIETVIRGKGKAYFIGGHSVGGAIASVIGDMLRYEGCEVYTRSFGGKRPIKGTEDVAINYRHRGDIVPFLPPWRPAYKMQPVIERWLPFWKAHGPSTYYEAMEECGFR